MLTLVTYLDKVSIFIVMLLGVVVDVVSALLLEFQELSVEGVGLNVVLFKSAHHLFEVDVAFLLFVFVFVQ